MFRRLYWVIEAVQEDRSSQICGVYTSIPDLIRRGLSHGRDGKLRLTLTKLDSDKAPLGTWTAPHFEGLERDLQPYVATEEFSTDECKALMDALQSESKAAA